MIVNEQIGFTGQERRQYYRLLYPMRERPPLLIGRSRFSVIDLSERGIRFRVDADDRLIVAQRIAAAIRGPRADTSICVGDLAFLPMPCFAFLPEDPASEATPAAPELVAAPKSVLHLWGRGYHIASATRELIQLRDPENEILRHAPEMQAHVALVGREAVEVEGRLIRVGRNYAVLYLTSGIPGYEILREQIRLIRKYPCFT